MSNALVMEMDHLTFSVREIALGGLDARYPKFAEVLLLLSRNLRKAALALAKGRLAVREFRDMCDELEALIERYFPPTPTLQ